MKILGYMSIWSKIVLVLVPKKMLDGHFSSLTLEKSMYGSTCRKSCSSERRGKLCGLELKAIANAGGIGFVQVHTVFLLHCKDFF